MKSSLMLSLLNNNNISALYYCISFKMKNGKKLYYTTNSSPVNLEDIEYSAKPGISILKIVTNEGGQDYIKIQILYDESIYIDELLEAEVKIIAIISEEKNAFHYFTMNVTNILDNKGSIIIRLEPETFKLQKTLLKTYSRTCRAEFTDFYCKLRKDLFITNYDVEAIEEYKIILQNCSKENNYYSAGKVIFEDGSYFNIVSHAGQVIQLERAMTRSLLKQKTVKLLAGCDKKFTTCCNKFNNAINFRGEPSIPGNKIINDKSYV